VPKDCVFDFEFRYIPGDDPEALYAEIRRFAETRLLPEMRAARPETGIDFRETTAFPGLSTPLDAEVTELALALTGANSTGHVSFGTEAGLFQQAEIPAVVCGPGSIEQAHKPNEFIAVEQVRQCEAFVARLMERVAA
jgi:acetylornithine deacetylase